MWGVKFWSLPLKWLVTLTTVLRYRAACDAYTCTNTAFCLKLPVTPHPVIDNSLQPSAPKHLNPQPALSSIHSPTQTALLPA